MIKTKDGYAKLIGTTYSGSISRVLLSNGGDYVLGNSSNNIPLNNGTVNTNLNADKVDGYHASSLWRSDGATWNPGANISLNASANNQEWSFDIRRNGYTGCYWHVLDSTLNSLLKVNADNGKVYAPYNFVGNLEGNSSTATALTSSAGSSNTPIYFIGGKPAVVSLIDTANNLINNLSIGNSIPVDKDYYIAQYVNGGTTTTTFHRRPHSALYNYIKNKASGTWNISISGNSATASRATTADTAGALYSVAKADPGSACSDGQNVKWFNNITKPSDLAYAGTNAGFPVTNNANGILWLGTHSGPYGWQIGFSSNSRIYARYISNNTFPTTANGGSWNRIAWTSDIPTVTNYWWANVKISNTSNTDTLPTFGSTTIKNRLSIASSTLTKTTPIHLQLVINGPNLDSSVTPRLTDWPGIGFHMPNRGWASLIYNGNFTAINSNYDGYINYFGAGFKKNGSDNTYVLLGGGGHKLISDFATSSHTHSWNSITNKPCILISYSRNSESIDANNWKVKLCSLIEIRNAELTYSNLAMSGYNSFFNFWTPDGIVCTQFQIGDGAFYYRSKQSGSTTITTNWNRIMDSNNCSVSKSGETLTVKINGTSQSLTNTWRGILDNLISSTNTTQSLSAKQGYLLANGSARDNTKLPLSGGTMTGVIKSTYTSSTWINGVTNAILKGEYTGYGAILSMPVKNGRVSLSSYPSSDNFIYFGYASSANINAGTNNFSKKMYWDAANNKLVADTFLGALWGNATTATTATKLSTSSAGSASLPVYFSNGIPVVCTGSSIFSNLSNNGDQLSVTVAGYNRLLTVAYASRAGSAIDADYAASSDWAEDALHASSADSATNADYATDADTLDGYHSYEFSLSGHTHTLKLESSTEASSINLAHGGKYKLTAGGNSVIFTLPTDTASITFSGGLISSSNNTLTQASHSITIGGQTETAGYSTCNIINNLSINSLSSSSTTNLIAQITVNGVTSALKTITQLHSRFWDVTRNSVTSNISPGNYSATITEVYGNASGITGNLPTDSWYHVYTAAGQDTKYATLLALGMTTDGIWYRKYSNSSWGSWLTVLHSGNIGNYYWANISISSTRNTNTTPRFGQVKINTDSSSYQLNVEGDSYITGWSRAKNGFYCEGNGVYFTHNGTKGEITVKNNNEFCWGSNSNTLYFNYAAPLNGTPVKNYIWNAGSSSTYASHTTGDIILGSSSNSNYQLKRVGSLSDWYNGRDKAIIRQTSAASGYSVVISSKTTNGSWEIGNESNDLMFTYITDSNYNSKNDDFLGLLYITSEGEVHSNNDIYATHFFENSDIRYKKILKNLLINSNTIANLPLFDFEWIENNTIGTGTSALAVLLILPNLVSGTDRLTLDYGVLGTIAGITACKELVILKSELLQLKEKVKLLEDKLRKYENT